MGSQDQEESVLAEGSDDEEFNKIGLTLNHVWSPKLEEVEDIYKEIKTNKVIELEWKCPGRRDPNQPLEEIASTEINQATEIKDSDADDFAFDVEEETPSTIKTGRLLKNKKATTKKTTTLAGILSKMERHRLIDSDKS